jgi:hypothetical protein
MPENSNSIVGGYYIGTDGTAHDANGKPLPLREEPKTEEAVPPELVVLPEEQAIAKPKSTRAPRVNK